MTFRQKRWLVRLLTFFAIGAPLLTAWALTAL